MMYNEFREIQRWTFGNAFMHEVLTSLTGWWWRVWCWSWWEITGVKSWRCWDWYTAPHWSSQWTVSGCTLWICASYSSQGLGGLGCRIWPLSLL